MKPLNVHRESQSPKGTWRPRGSLFPSRLKKNSSSVAFFCRIFLLPHSMWVTKRLFIGCHGWNKAIKSISLVVEGRIEDNVSKIGYALQPSYTSSLLSSFSCLFFFWSWWEKKKKKEKGRPTHLLNLLQSKWHELGFNFKKKEKTPSSPPPPPPPAPPPSSSSSSSCCCCCSRNVAPD